MFPPTESTREKKTWREKGTYVLSLLEHPKERETERERERERGQERREKQREREVTEVAMNRNRCPVKT